MLSHTNPNLYAYAANNPVKYTDPDGRKIIHTHYLAFQNLNPNKLVPMGKTPSGVYDPETKEVIKQNTIGDYGCLFTSSMNIANDIKRRYCEKGAVGMPKNVIIPATSIAEMANSDKYFIYNDDLEKNESNADMGIENVKKLIEDVSSCSISIEMITGSENIKKAIATLNSSESDNGYIIGHVKGHFFNLTGTEKKMGYLYHDPYVRSNAAADRLKERINNSMDKIYIIRVIGNE